MTRNKDKKRLVRARMTKTGESYTAARKSLFGDGHAQNNSGKEAPPAVVPSDEWPKLVGQSDAVVFDKTGSTWVTWVKRLDESEAYALPHPQIVKLILKEYPVVSYWWAQTITVGYERIRGLRDVSQRRGGSYVANKSRTFPVSVELLFSAFFDTKQRAEWLPRGIKDLRTAAKNQSLRFDWEDGTQVNLYFVSKGANKSSVAAQHTKLADKAAVARAKEDWTARFDALARTLHG